MHTHILITPDLGGCQEQTAGIDHKHEYLLTERWVKGVVDCPFVGQGGMVNQLLTKRVLPIVAGFTALRYADYLLGHKPSNSLIDIPLKANVLRADLTDMVPGGRSITDFYDAVVPGPQYGPLALPLLGAGVGALWHYQKVVRGVFDKEAAVTGKIANELRDASSRLFSKIETLNKAGTWSFHPA